MRILLSVVLAFVITAPMAWAIDLQSAKDQGLVGEMMSGYLGVVKSPPSAEVKALIDDVNGKRKQNYMRIAKEVNKPLSVVEKLAAEKAHQKTKPGHYVQTASGGWVKR